MTGADLHLWLAVLDAIPDCEQGGLVTMSQSRIAAAMGQVSPDRLTDSFARMVGYDVWIENSVGPMVRGADWDRAPDGSVRWYVSLDHRVIKAVRQSAQAGDGIQVQCGKLRKLSSRYSTVVYLRTLAWKAGIYPPRNIEFQSESTGAAYRISVDVPDLQWLYGHDTIMSDSEILKRFHSKNALCPLRRELRKVDFDYETAIGRIKVGGTGIRHIEAAIFELEVREPLVIPRGAGKFDQLRWNGSRRPS
jgi:hypothetical protein